MTYMKGTSLMHNATDDNDTEESASMAKTKKVELQVAKTKKVELHDDEDDHFSSVMETKLVRLIEENALSHLT